MARPFAEIAFTPNVRTIQETQGSAASYAKFLAPEAERGDQIGPREAEFIIQRDGFIRRRYRNPAGLMRNSVAGRAGSWRSSTRTQSLTPISKVTGST